MNYILQGRRAQAVTPSDTDNIPNPAGSTNATQPAALYAGANGDIAVIMEGGDEVTFVGIKAGTFLPIAVTRVKATGTSVTNILAIW